MQENKILNLNLKIILSIILIKVLIIIFLIFNNSDVLTNNNPNYSVFKKNIIHHYEIKKSIYISKEELDFIFSNNNILDNCILFQFFIIKIKLITPLYVSQVYENADL
jgi:hypothetical protein